MEDMDIADLKAECQRLGIDNTGSKAVVVLRLTNVAMGNPANTPSRRSSRKSSGLSNSVVKAAIAEKGLKNRGSSKKAVKKPATSKSPAPARTRSTPKRAAIPTRSSSSTRTTRSTTKSAAKVEDEDNTSNFPFFPWQEDAKAQGGVLSEAGKNNIANHKYKGGHYTTLDTFLNPFWEWCTTCLPMSMAPNTVTTLGCLMLIANFAIIWYYNPLFDSQLPKWVFAFNGLMEFWYYTFDCMDGKQSRRTGTSSPLGQLFDHGCDCLGNISHFSVVSAILLPGACKLTLIGQLSLQFSFFCAQWQEYHTRELPHSVGNFGVTELSHGTSLFCISFYVLDNVAIFRDITIFDQPLGVFVVQVWIGLQFFLVFCSLKMTVFNGEGGKLGKICHLLSPMIGVLTSLIIPNRIIATEIRFLSVSFGLLFSLITNKMIVFSMAKMSFSSIQKDVFPLLAMSLALKYGNFDGEMNHTIVVGVMLWQIARVVWWSGAAISQLCRKLDINCFTIKNKKE
ncbi:hypothetical protein ScalyP_jg9645 [Parmales sp. scaly parma]|nr:hypothetical protein ScalyP_jg9645 [Parmales sp. scaly parma]